MALLVFFWCIGLCCQRVLKGRKNTKAFSKNTSVVFRYFFPGGTGCVGELVCSVDITGIVWVFLIG